MCKRLAIIMFPNMLYAGKVDGPHRTSFRCFVMICCVQQACRQRVVNMHIIGVAAWDQNLCLSLSMQSIFRLHSNLPAVTVKWTTVKCADLAGRHDTAYVSDEEYLQLNAQHVVFSQPYSNPADAHHLSSAQSSETTLTMLSDRESFPSTHAQAVTFCVRSTIFCFKSLSLQKKLYCPVRTQTLRLPS